MVFLDQGCAKEWQLHRGALLDFGALLIGDDASCRLEPRRTSMKPTMVFVGSLAVIAIAGRELAAAGRALGVPASVIGLLESVALR